MKTDKKALILDSAEQLMTQMTSEELTINLIASNAGIGKGSIYYYFKSKEEIIGAVIERCYKKAIREYFSVINSHSASIEKFRALFECLIRKEFHNKQQNIMVSLHLRESLMLNYKMKLAAIEVVSPILTDILRQGIDEGTMQSDTPVESAEIIVATITFLLDGSIFPYNRNKMKNKLKILANVLDTCLHTPTGSFDFLYKDLYNSLDKTRS